MVDRSDNHEEAALEQSMGEKINHRACDGSFIRRPYQHDQQAERSDGGIGKRQFQICLAQAHPCSHKKGNCAEDWQNGHPERSITHDGMNAHQQIDTSLDHGCGMQIGRNRSWEPPWHCAASNEKETVRIW